MSQYGFSNGASFVFWLGHSDADAQWQSCAPIGHIANIQKLRAIKLRIRLQVRVLESGFFFGGGAGYPVKAVSHVWFVDAAPPQLADCI